jgi:hypothetical protein
MVGGALHSKTKGGRSVIIMFYYKTKSAAGTQSCGFFMQQIYATKTISLINYQKSYG